MSEIGAVLIALVAFCIAGLAYFTQDMTAPEVIGKSLALIMIMQVCTLVEIVFILRFMKKDKEGEG